MYVIDIELAMGTDWKVCICVCSLSSILRRLLSDSVGLTGKLPVSSKLVV